MDNARGNAADSPRIPARTQPRFTAHPLLRSSSPCNHPKDKDGPADVLAHTLLSDSPSTPQHADSHAVSRVDRPAPPSACAFPDHSSAIGGPEPSTVTTAKRAPPRTRSATHDDELEMKPLAAASATGNAQRHAAEPAHRAWDAHASDETSTSTAVQTRRYSVSSQAPLLAPATGHTPVAASAIFARKAAPLALPALDAYISTLPAPTFPSFDASKGTMFPPLDRLEASGKSLDDLEHNATIPHWWQNRSKYFGSLSSISLSITGSSALVSLWSLHGLIDTMQIFALLLNTIEHKTTDTQDQWRNLVLGTIPNILALNLVTGIRVALALLIVFMTIAGVLLYFFRRATSLCCRLGTPEGLQQPTYLANSWGLLLTSFFLTAIYLPLSTMAIHVLVWSDDIWVVPNPYTNATTLPPVLPPLGPADEFRDPLDFCWTTTMERNEINWAPVVVIIAVVCLYALTIWFPLHLRRAIAQVAPTVDEYTELGTRRSNDEMDREYQRLLDRDKNPLQFLYHDYRRGWATYQALYLFAKLAALLIVAVVDPSNCLFRTLAPHAVETARQITLLVAMAAFFLVQCFAAPFLDPVGNASEWTSRMNYVLTALLALLVALDVPGHAAFGGWVLYLVYGITYGLSVYFTVIDWSIVQRLVKRLSRRLDFSIDVFSPRINLTHSCPHTKRRIWQEAISALFLTNPECGIPKSQPMQFAQARDAEYPPYLLAFAGTPAERHVENLKILREVGHVAYERAVDFVHGPESAQFKDIREAIQQSFVGPDCYWKNPAQPAIPGCRRHFGNAWFVPFPPTVVIRYDDGPLAVISTIADLALYVKQNASHDVQRRREVRMALRALDGQVVFWPYDHIQPVGARRPLLCCLPGRRFRAQTVFHYRAGVFRLKRHGLLPYGGLNLGSGFEVALTYARSVVVGGAAIGLDDDFDLTTPLARFLALNEELIPGPLTLIEEVLERYRHALKDECERKAAALSYRFLALVYDRPHEPTGLAASALATEQDARVRELVRGSEDVFRITYERFAAVATAPLATWWYIFWDDLWRRNRDTIGALKQHAADFNPHYPSSVAYTPLPRAALESFLAQRGLLHAKPKWGDVFHAGLLNKMYLRMNDIVFHGTQRADILHLGANSSAPELDMEDVDRQTLARPSTLGTGGGTDADDASIRARPLYRWEGILEDPLRKTKRTRQPLLAKLGVWFGLTPLWRSGAPSMGLALDVRLDSGRYILLQDEDDTTQ